MVAEGDGFARDQSGKVVFVEGALPGELVTARIVSESKDYARGVAVDIIEASEHRVRPPCPHVVRGCGGCDLQHADDALQMAIKRDIVEESLRRLGGIASPQVRSKRSPDGEVRMRTTVRVAGAQHGVGFRRRRSHDVVPIDACHVAHPRINEIVSELVLEPGTEAVVRVSASTGEATLWTEPAEALLRRPSGVHVGVDASLRETIAGVELRVSAGAFFQSSPGAARALVDAVSRALGDPNKWPSGPVVDAFAGVGLFAATVVPESRPLIVIESNSVSCADARVNLIGRTATIVESRVEDWKVEPAAIVIADPARDGLRARAVDVLTESRPSIFVLVSCDPASLGRDARLLTDRGYRLEYCEVLDAFPHTHHVEAVSRFIRSQTPEST